MIALLLLLAIGCTSRHAYPDGRGLEGQLEREVVALNQRTRSLEGELAHCVYGGKPGPIFPTLNQVFVGSEIEIQKRGGITIVSLPVGHLFSDSYGLRFREESHHTLDLLATVLNRYADQPVVIEGHTDDRMLPGSLVRRFGSHLDLSFQYAAAVMQRLTEEHAVAEHRFTVAGRGPWAPIATNDTQAGQSRNQRVEVHIYPAGAR